MELSSDDPCGIGSNLPSRVGRAAAGKVQPAPHAFHAGTRFKSLKGNDKQMFMPASVTAGAICSM
jgi:hypothetical protein